MFLAPLCVAVGQFQLAFDRGHGAVTRLERRHAATRQALAVPTWNPPKAAADRLHERQHRAFADGNFAAPLGPGLQLAEIDAAPAPPRENDAPRSRWGVLGEAWAPPLTPRAAKSLAPSRSWAQGGHVAGPQ